MPIDYKQTLSTLCTYRGYSGDYNASPQVITCPQLPFTWHLGFNPSWNRFEISWHDVKNAILLGRISLSVLVNDKVLWTVTLGDGPFPPTPSGALYSSSMTARHATATIRIQSQVKGESSWSMTEHAGRAAVAPSFLAFLPSPTDALPTASFTSRQPNNVCFTFSRTSLKLWANEPVLRDDSPYFEALFAWDFPEAKPSDRSTTSKDTSSLPPYTYEEPDEETDTLATPAKENTPPSPSDLPSCKVVRVTDTSYSTYFAVLVWIAAGSISFAPLLSKHRTFLQTDEEKSLPSSKKARLNAVVSLAKDANPLLPPPVSPKSVYRLAHLLELDDLSSLALANFASQLTAHNAAHELYSDVSCAYKAVRELALQYVVENWKDVKDSKAMKAVEARAEAGEATSEQAVIAMQLARALMEKHAK